MAEKPRTTVTMKGEEKALVGQQVALGQAVPDFTCMRPDLEPVYWSDLKGKPTLISAVVSLDTPVCDKETRRWSQEVKERNAEVRLITVSMDLPFAQQRWADETETEDMELLSDYRDASFGTSQGLLIKELRLLARAVLLIDSKGNLTYRQIVAEVTDAPDYEDVLCAVDDLK